MTTQRPLVSRWLLFAVLILLTAHCSLLTASAQTATATLSGTVTDQNGAVVPGADVTIINTATGLQRQAKSNDEGSFTVPLLPPSTYSVRVQSAGFSPIEIPNVVLNVGDQKGIQIQLKAGDVTAEVQVSNEAALINESPAVGTVVDRQFVGNLPLNGRSLQSLILLTPGVVPTVSNSATPGQFSVNGQRSNANYFTVDGVSASTGVTAAGVGSPLQAGTVPGFSALGSSNNLVSIDALEEFKILTSTYSAEFGRQPGAQVQLVTRSGGNDFHGTAFEYVRNEAFDANDWFANEAGLKRAPLRQNQFGGTFSGPVMLPSFGEGGKSYWSGRNRSFFFFSYEGQRLLLPTTVNILVPSLRLRQQAPEALRTILNTFSLPTGPETITTEGTLSGVAPFVGSYSNRSTLDATSIRHDHTVNSKLTLFGRYNHAPSNSSSRELSSLTEDRYNTRTLTLGASVSLTSQMSNELRFNYSYSRGRRNSAMDNYGGAVTVDQSVLLSGYSGPGTKFGRVLFNLPGSGLISALGDFIDSYQRQINLVDNVSLFRSSHQLRFGFDYRRLATIYGPVAYNQTANLDSESDILSGKASSVFITARQATHPLFDNLSAYAEDTWNLSRRFRLTAGVRWELNPPPHDANGLKPALVVGLSNLPTAMLAPPNAPLYDTVYTAFAPRLGFAYELRQTKGSELVFRGGFGRYYDLGSGQAGVGFGGFPFSANKFIFSTPLPLSSALAVPPSFPTLTLPTTQILTVLDSQLRLPYTWQWNFSAEQSLGSNQTLLLSYVASIARNLLTSRIINQRVGTPPTRPNPNFSFIRYTTNGPTSDYHSLQAQVRRRMSRGLQAIVNYTWSHAIDEVSDEASAGGALDRGNADFDVRHLFTAGITYDIPKLDTGPILRTLIRGWSIDSTVYVQSGSALNLSAGSAVREDGTQYSVRPDVLAATAIWINDPIAPGGRRINRAAFRSPPVDSAGNFTRQGTLARNVVRLPGSYQLNLAVRRQFALSEKWKLQLKAEAFNVFNHPLFAEYDSDISSSTFGVARTMLNSKLGGLSPLYQSGGPRSMQFSARLTF